VLKARKQVSRVEEEAPSTGDLFLESLGPRRPRRPPAAAEDDSDSDSDSDSESAEAEGVSGRRGGRSRGCRRSALRTAFTSHAQRLSELLHAEYDAELDATEERLLRWPPERLLAEGYALFGLAPRREADLQNSAVFRFEAAGARRSPAPQPTQGLLAAARARREGRSHSAAQLLSLPELPPEHRFMVGSMVSATPGRAAPGSTGATSVSGVVLERSPAWLKVAFSESSAAQMAAEDGDGAGVWRLDLAANAVAHERMLRGLDTFSQLGAMPRTSLEEEGATAASYSALQRALLGGDGAGESAAMQPCWLPAGKSGRRAADAAAAAACAGLNESQRGAVSAALGRTLTVWQGPPGTGKTRTLLAFICAALRLRTGAGPCVLACAPSNVAADHLLEGLLEGQPGVRVVRLGAPAKVAPHLRRATLFAAAAQHPQMVRATQLRSAARAAGGDAGAAAALRRAAREAEATALQETLCACDVVVATCSGAGDESLLGELSFSWAVVDEATQATEPACMLPLVRARAALLVGDAAQLPPTVVSEAACQGGLELSLPERLQAVAPSLLLDTQYRMHPALAAFPSLRFYRGRVRSAPTEEQRPAPPGFPWPSHAQPLAFMDVRHGAERRDAAGDSVSNAAEATLCAHIVHGLLCAQHGLKAHQLGVVTPYAAQVRLIGRALRSRLGAAAAAEVSVRSVDGFQGQERELILFSAVRANADRQLGFTADARRLNVALTRAKRGLIVLGQRQTLRADPHWAAWLRHVDAGRWTLEAPELPLIEEDGDEYEAPRQWEREL